MFGFRQIGIKRVLLGAGFLPSFGSTFSDDIPRESKTHTAMQEAFDPTQMTGKDRLYRMFSINEFGDLSPELTTVLHSTLLAAFAGAGIGGFVRSRTAFLRFIETNDATKFIHHTEAKQKLQNKVTVAFGKGAFQWGWRLSAFTGLYMAISSGMAAYKGKDGFIEYCVAGLVTGAVVRINVGVRGVVVGGTLGLVLGTLGGLTVLGLCALSGKTMTEMRNIYYAAENSRTKQWQIAYTEHNKEKALPVELQREEFEYTSHDLSQLNDDSTSSNSSTNPSTTTNTNPSTTHTTKTN